MLNSPRLLPWLGLLALLSIAWFVYAPGLSGGFLFDDFVNLDALGNSGPVDNWRTFWRYVTSGTADPIGRPLALLSFLIDARDWPAEPEAFLRTNVLLHLCNGALLFALLRSLGRALGPDGPRNSAAALLAAGMWLLHPLFVSTTLYVVQREAMLPATFTLLGLLVYAEGRNAFDKTHGRIGMGRMLCGLGLGTLLAVLSKANGILLPLLAGTLEITVFNHSAVLNHPAGKILRRFRWLALVLPGLLVFAYLASFFPDLNAPLAHRPWTIGQRLLTEPRVLLDYLFLLAVPRSMSTGLYNDDYAPSLDLWQPAATLPAALAIVGLVVLAFRLRRSAPSLSAALLFFFAGHLLESSAVPLELYFEHRNYLPALLLFWPLARTLCVWSAPMATRIAVASAIIALLAFTTHGRVELWGQPKALAALWARQNPESSRAQATIAIAESETDPEQAMRRLAPLWQQRPLDLQIAFNFINAVCASSGLSKTDKDALSHALRHANAGVQMVNPWLSKAIDTAASGDCLGLAIVDIETLVDAALQNPTIANVHTRDQDMEPLLAQIAIKKQNPILALKHFNAALASFITPDVAARNASMLAANGYYEQGLAHLDYYEQIKQKRSPPALGMPLLHAKVLEWQDYWAYEMATLREKLSAEIAVRADADMVN